MIKQPLNCKAVYKLFVVDLPIMLQHIVNISQTKYIEQICWRKYLQTVTKQMQTRVCIIYKEFI